jgi:nucleotide-binding universal stress UspA family protein
MAFLNRILVTTDFSSGSRAAADRAARLASQYHAELILIHATPDWNLFSRWTSASEDHHKAITHYAHDAMRAEVSRLASEFGVHARSEIQLGRASRMITGAAAEYRPDLIVAGARGEHQPKVSPEAFGGTTLKLLLHTEYPLLDEAVRATESAAHRLVSDVIKAAAPQAQIHSHIVRGSPLGCLVTEIARNQPTLVVLGRQEAGASESFDPFGTEGLRMAYHCPVDTLVVP